MCHHMAERNAKNSTSIDAAEVHHVLKGEKYDKYVIILL